MKTIFAANDNLNAFTQNSLLRYSLEEGADTVVFAYPDHKAGTRRLAELLFAALTENADERFLIVADHFGSTAYNEAALLLARAGLTERAQIVFADQMPKTLRIEDADTFSLAA